MTVRTKTITGKGTPTGLKNEVGFTYEVFNGGDVPPLGDILSFLRSRGIPDNTPDGVVLNSKGGLEWQDEPEPVEGEEVEVGERGRKEIPLSINLMLVRYFKQYNQQKARAQAFSDALNTEDAVLTRFNQNASSALKSDKLSAEKRRMLELVQKFTSGTMTRSEQEEYLGLVADLTPVIA